MSLDLNGESNDLDADLESEPYGFEEDDTDQTFCTTDEVLIGIKSPNSEDQRELVLDLMEQLLDIVPQLPASKNRLPNPTVRQRLMMRRIRLATVSLIQRYDQERYEPSEVAALWTIWFGVMKSEDLVDWFARLIATSMLPSFLESFGGDD